LKRIAIGAYSSVENRTWMFEEGLFVRWMKEDGKKDLEKVVTRGAFA
jgi:hypothetical protein